ncbi:MAG: 3-oxoadipyl-CoA thiolase [Rhodobacteraceae bacterium]|nr:3-oxoadipyl-CoA thiolase [Paracoccaceae bacterium]
MSEAFICDYVRTPIGRFGGLLSVVRTDDLAAIPLKALAERNPELRLDTVDEVCLGCANQAGEDNRNVARMALLLAGFPHTVPAVTLNRLCGSGMDAVAYVARQILSGEAELGVAGGVESMSRAPFVIPKAGSAFSRSTEIHDTTIGWRFVNPLLKTRYGIDSMPETAENLAADLRIDRDAQDLFAFGSQKKAAHAQSSGRFAAEITPVTITRPKGESEAVTVDEHPRLTSLEKLATLPTPFRQGGSVTAGNSSGVNDGAAALLIATEAAAAANGLVPIARIVGCATTGCEPRIMGIGPVSATRKLCARHQLNVDDFSFIELNEAFASQCLAVLRTLGIEDSDPRVNPNGGAIALGHPLGMSGARIVGTAALELQLQQQQLALATMCVGVGQGIAMAVATV